MKFIWAEQTFQDRLHQQLDSIYNLLLYIYGGPGAKRVRKLPMKLRIFISLRSWSINSRIINNIMQKSITYTSYLLYNKHFFQSFSQFNSLERISTMQIGQKVWDLLVTHRYVILSSLLNAEGMVLFSLSPYTFLPLERSI